MGLKTDDSIWVWGNIIFSTPASASLVRRNTPTRLGLDNDWKNISVGNNFFLAIKLDGRLFGYGQNLDGQIYNSPQVDGITNLVQIGSESDWSECSAGAVNSGAIKNNGTLWTWGRNQFGQIGNGTTSSTESIGITQVGPSNDWKSISVGVCNNLAIKTDGTLWGYGSNADYTLGTGNDSQKNSPFRIGIENDWKYISTGYTLSHAIKNNK